MRSGSPVLALAVSGTIVVGLLAGCAAGPKATAGGPTFTPLATEAATVATTATGLALTPLGLRPAQRSDAAIGLAFEPASAGRLLAEAPAGIDFGRTALLCVYLGERIGNWSLTLVSARLEGGTLQILSREAPPRGSTGSTTTTYPAACGTVARAALPSGPLAVRADDTASGEFIVASTVVVPAP
jgi:hypothetical protein